MKAILLMFDSLNRLLLSPYGCSWTHTPNFARLARRTAVFDRCYAGSLPCMPARRELHTGRYNFLHRSWGPMEPFDDSAPELLGERGVHTHLISDHYHYWEDGGATYHTRYRTWEGFRGQEGDPWKCVAAPDGVDIPPNRNGRGAWGRQDWINRSCAASERETPQARTFEAAFSFLDRNHSADNWFLHVEAFDPHEPFFVPERFLGLYEDSYDGPAFDWPFYGEAVEDEKTARHLRARYAALLSQCDESLGRFLDRMDQYRLWDDTLLIVNTDHGFLLGEHGHWAKCVVPFYEEVAHIPLFVWDPRSRRAGVRDERLVQTIDLPATLLDFFGVSLPADMQGCSLLSGSPAREAALFGINGGQVGCTDGRFVYLRSPSGGSNGPLNEYTLMPTRHGNGRAFIPAGELRHARLHPGFPFTKGCPVLQIPSVAETGQFRFPTALYDLKEDPRQQHPLADADLEDRMARLMAKLMRENDAPTEQFARLGLSGI